MTRVQFRLPEQEYEAARKEALRLGISLAELVRRALQARLPCNPAKPWMRYAGMVDSRNPEASATIDEVVYGGDL